MQFYAIVRKNKFGQAWKEFWIMKNKILAYALKFCTVFSLALAVLNINTACMDMFHQAEIPEALMKYKK